MVIDEKIKSAMSKIKHKIIVISGKGGVGKSTVSVNLAYFLALNGRRVGLLDVDIHGPNIAKLMGIEGQFMTGSEGRIYPVLKDNIKVVSMASLMTDQELPIIWRGPLKMKIISQFLGDIEWGELDYLVIDSPPGTGDEPLSVIQLIPDIDGSLIVTTPQDVATLDATKTINFSKTLNIPIIGVIENMSGFICPNCGAEVNIFGTGGGERIASQFNVDFLGSIPLDPKIVKLSDEGKPFVYVMNETPAGKAMVAIAKYIMEKVEKGNGK